MERGQQFFAEGLSGPVTSGLGKVRYLNLWGRGGLSDLQGSTSKEEIKCVCLNARSIINKKSELNIMVDDIKPHIIGITESWANIQ